MRLILTIICCTALQMAAALDDFYSFYFHKNSLFELSSVRQVAPQLFGKYELRDLPQNEIRRAAGEFLYVDESGIYLQKNKLLHISREEVRENSKYWVKGNYLFGIVQNDSVPVALEDENYYFLLPSKTYLFESRGGANRMMQISRTRYALFSFEDVGHYSVIVVDFGTGTLELREINFAENGPTSIELVEKKEVDETISSDYKTFILTPSKSAWNIIFAKCLDTYDHYNKVIE